MTSSLQIITNYNQTPLKKGSKSHNCSILTFIYCTNITFRMKGKVVKWHFKNLPIWGKVLNDACVSFSYCCELGLFILYLGIVNLWFHIYNSGDIVLPLMINQYQNMVFLVWYLEISWVAMLCMLSAGDLWMRLATY